MKRTEEERARIFDAVSGCLLGGAIGDALGYPVEFMSIGEIKRKFGPDGIADYELDFEEGQAVVSDDTQMTLFTADGLLSYETGRTGARENGAVDEIRRMYREGWLRTQAWKPAPGPANAGWLMDVPMMWARRAPGNTCLSALHMDERGTISDPINDSKGCGGVMRAAPAALYDPNPGEIDRLSMLGAEIAAITHGHPLGYLPAAALVHIVSRAAFGGCVYGDGLKGIVRECCGHMEQLFPGKPGLDVMLGLIEEAADRAENHLADTENIDALGGGWVAEETLAISLYCCLRYPHDFSKAVIAAVNHSGDSDSTGAVAGNIMGALLGRKAIEDKWFLNLEMRGVIEEMAADLCTHIRMKEEGLEPDAVWMRKYAEHRWKEIR